MVLTAPDVARQSMLKHILSLPRAGLWHGRQRDGILSKGGSRRQKNAMNVTLIAIGNLIVSGMSSVA